MAMRSGAPGPVVMFVDQSDPESIGAAMAAGVARQNPLARDLPRAICPIHRHKRAPGNDGRGNQRFFS